MPQENGQFEKAFVRAAAAAYVWVSISDGPLKEVEVDGFIDFLLATPYVDSLSDDQFMDIYLNLVALFERDYEQGRQRAVMRLSIFQNDPERAKEIFKVAQKSLTADSQLSEREELVLSEIASILNIKET